VPAAAVLTAYLLRASPAQDLPPAPPPSPARVGVAEGASLSRGEDAVVISVGEVQLHRSDVFRQLDLAAPARSAEVIRQMVLTTAAEMDARREGIDVPREQLDKEVEAAIAEQRASFALEVDETLPLVAGDKTLWRLLRLVDRVPPSTASWAEVRDTVEAALASRPLEAEELAVFEARAVDRYRVSRPARSP
jgi:hypothetical protein